MGASRVPVVDDDHAIVEIISLALEDAGYRVYRAPGGEALRVARALHPDVILLDVTMPVMGGAEVSQLLRAESATADIPIVAMTTLHPSRVPPAMRADAWLQKPFELGDLYSVVNRWAAMH